MPDTSQITALILLVDGTEWDRARIYNGNYTYECALRQMDEWREKVLREEPEAKVEVVAALTASSLEC